jgi:hypothetical protein
MQAIREHAQKFCQEQHPYRHRVVELVRQVKELL